MSPQCTEDYLTRRPVSRSNTRRELSEEEKARKKRSYELWKIKREKDRLHEERKKRFIEEYNWKKRMDQHGRTGSQQGDHPRSPDPPERRSTGEEIKMALKIFEKADPRQVALLVSTSSGGNDPPPTVRTDPAPAPPPPRGILRRAESPRRYDGDGAPHGSSSHPRLTEGRSPSRNRILSRSPHSSRSRQRRHGGRPTSRNRTRSKSPQHRSSRAQSPGPIASTSREHEERRSEVKNEPEEDLHRRRLHAQRGHDSRAQSPGPRASTSGRLEGRRSQVNNKSKEYRLHGRFQNYQGYCHHNDDPSRKHPCPLDPGHCSHARIVHCACHRCPRCKCVACKCRPRTAPAPRQETLRAPQRVSPPAQKPVVPPTDRPVPPQVPPAIRRPPSPPEYPLPSHLDPQPPGRIYLYFPMGPLPAHHIATRKGSPLHHWWQRYRNMPNPGAPPIHIPFLQPYFTPDQIPPVPQRLDLVNVWYPPPPPRGPYYHGGPPAYPWPNANFRHY